MTTTTTTTDHSDCRMFHCNVLVVDIAAASCGGSFDHPSESIYGPCGKCRRARRLVRIEAVCPVAERHTQAMDEADRASSIS